ncbi:hypothetical protein TB2_037347 [Malus domestica]
MILLTFHSFDLKLVWNSERGILEFLGFPVCILFCLFLRHGRQARGRGDGLFLSSIFPRADNLLSFSLSLAEDELVHCLHMLRGIIFTSLICSPSGCGSLRKHKMFKNEYSKARLGKQSGRGSRQSVPDRKIDTKCWLIALFLLVPLM